VRVSPIRICAWRNLVQGTGESLSAMPGRRANGKRFETHCELRGYYSSEVSLSPQSALKYSLVVFCLSLTYVCTRRSSLTPVTRVCSPGLPARSPRSLHGHAGPLGVLGREARSAHQSDPLPRHDSNDMTVFGKSSNRISDSRLPVRCVAKKCKHATIYLPLVPKLIRKRYRHILHNASEVTRTFHSSSAPQTAKKR
jgi:hypothetical protein